MNGAKPEGLHDRFCANRSVATAAIFVACCALVLVAFWRASGRPPVADSGAFSHFYDACVVFGIGLSFTVFKCVRERVVLALWLPTPVRALLFAAVPGLANWADLTYRLDFAASTIALVVSISMLISALRARNQPSVSPCL
jgi:hypothetical protein